MKTVEGGQMTKDLALFVGGDTPWLTTDEFLDALDTNLNKAMASPSHRAGLWLRPPPAPPRGVGTSGAGRPAGGGPPPRPGAG